MKNNDLKIRKATAKDFDALYTIGIQTPEFKVSSNGEFMEKDEFLSAIENPRGVLLLAELENAVVGFVYASLQDPERAPATKWACLVYIVVKPEHRKIGVAQELYNACAQELKNLGVRRLYGWASAESDGGIIKFMKKNGFSEGHKYIWMDKEI